MLLAFSIFFSSFSYFFLVILLFLFLFCFVVSLGLTFKSGVAMRVFLYGRFCVRLCFFIFVLVLVLVNRVMFCF